MLSGRAFLPEIRDLVLSRDFKTIREVMLEFSPADGADLLSQLAPEDRAVVFRLLPAAMAADIFEYLALDDQEALLRGLGQSQVAAMLNEMAPDDRTALLEELPGSVTKQLMDLLTPEERRIATALLGYPDHSVGRCMTPDYVTLREHWTISEVVEHLRRVGRDSETMNVLYVVEDRGVLIDDIRLREVILAPGEKRVADLMDRNFVALRVTDDQEEALHVFERYDRMALPVLDGQGILVGIVTADDILDIAREEATEDIHKLGGVEVLGGPYLEMGFFHMARKRGVWLSALFLGEMLTATAMAFFEKEIARAVVLALFVPLIISSGGNSGSQASTLVIRAMALGEVRLRDWWRVVRRELGVGLALGTALGAIGFLRIVLWQAVRPIYGEHYRLVALTVFGSLIGVVTFGTTAGSFLPFVLRRLGFDPASASAPFVATLVDVTGIVIYFLFASFILRGTLL